MLQMLTEKVVIAVTSLIQPVLTVGVSLAEKGLIPDVLVRVGIRCMLLESKAQLVNGTTETLQDRIMQFVFDAKKREIAEAPSDANKQHYEVDATFFKHVLGPHIKYSCCYFPRKDASLAEAEFRMLDLVMQRADVSDGHTILDLGCGWGSFALHAAYHCPHSTVHAVSNSKSQKDVIEAEALKLGLNNLSVFCADVNHWNAPTRYDRIISLEMFEHMKNYTKLLKRVHSWLKPQNQSKLFVHIFTHHTMPYHFEDTGGASGWMTRHVHLTPCPFVLSASLWSVHLMQQHTDPILFRFALSPCAHSQHLTGTSSVEEQCHQTPCWCTFCLETYVLITTGMFLALITSVHASAGSQILIRRKRR